jgi:hypothetical protein
VGDYFVVDTQINAIVEQHVNPETMAVDLEALKPHEHLAGEFSVGTE